MKSASPPNEHAPQHRAPTREFTMRFTSTPRGARLARRLVSHRLADWGHPYPTPVNETLTLITAELAANAVRHGHVPGRDFHLRLSMTEDVVRVEVTDTRGEAHPPPTAPAPDTTSESGRGLLLVTALADDWGVRPRRAAPGKTVWAELYVTTKDTASTDGRGTENMRASPPAVTTPSTTLWSETALTQVRRPERLPSRRGPGACLSAAPLVGDYLTARPTKICLGQSRHLGGGPVMVSLVAEIKRAPAEMNCRAAVRSRRTVRRWSSEARVVAGR
ncbi:ATP-binding protein [Streptomyces sp. NPDC005876]|uniref:ATP-binding protein n=1 Tax=Streptomyces sp. NPDC005876 TaxID=3157076 RepID=UPI0033C86616